MVHTIIDKNLLIFFLYLILFSYLHFKVSNMCIVYNFFFHKIKKNLLKCLSISILFSHVQSNITNMSIIINSFFHKIKRETRMPCTSQWERYQAILGCLGARTLKDWTTSIASLVLSSCFITTIMSFKALFTLYLLHL